MSATSSWPTASPPRRFADPERAIAQPRLLEVLGSQLDLARVEVAGAVVYENAAWGPLRAVVPGDVTFPDGATPPSERSLPALTNAPTALSDERAPVPATGDIPAGVALYLGVPHDDAYQLTVAGGTVPSRTVFGWSTAFDVSQAAGGGRISPHRPLVGAQFGRPPPGCWSCSTSSAVRVDRTAPPPRRSTGRRGRAPGAGRRSAARPQRRPFAAAPSGDGRWRYVRSVRIPVVIRDRPARWPAPWRRWRIDAPSVAIAAPVELDRWLPSVPGPDAGGSTWYCVAGTSSGDGGMAEQTVVTTNVSDRPAQVKLTGAPAGDVAPVVRTFEAPARTRADTVLSDVVVADNTAALVEVTGGQVAVSHIIRGRLAITQGPCATAPATRWFFPPAPPARWPAILAVYNLFLDVAVLDVAFVTNDGRRTPNRCRVVWSRPASWRSSRSPT